MVFSTPPPAALPFEEDRTIPLIAALDEEEAERTLMRHPSPPPAAPAVATPALPHAGRAPSRPATLDGHFSEPRPTRRASRTDRTVFGIAAAVFLVLCVIGARVATSDSEAAKAKTTSAAAPSPPRVPPPEVEPPTPPQLAAAPIDPPAPEPIVTATPPRHRPPPPPKPTDNPDPATPTATANANANATPTATANATANATPTPTPTATPTSTPTATPTPIPTSPALDDPY